MYQTSTCTKIIYLLETGGDVQGTEMILKLRLSSTCCDVKLPVLTTDTIFASKKKLQVSSQLGAISMQIFLSFLVFCVK
jgi:hypothetical protein